MTSLVGPSFQRVDEINGRELEHNGYFGPRNKPLLVKNALRSWPAWGSWSFERLSELRHADGSDAIVQFQNGLVEQGATRERPHLPVSPYLRELAQAAQRPHRDDAGLLSPQRLRKLKKNELFKLDWAYMQSFEADRLYLAQWNILDEFPALRQDFAIRKLWPGLRWTWEYVFIGPAHTVTGLHNDFPHNWFCQVRGVKEIILFSPEQMPQEYVSSKYDWGATLNSIDISRLHQQPEQLNRLGTAQGIYARVEPGDALFIPKRTWHAVVALEPSISLGVFGLTVPEIIIEGGYITLKDMLHKMHLYRWGNCTCHDRSVIR